MKAKYHETNPYRVRIDDYTSTSDCVLGRFAINEANHKTQHYAVLIDINDGNRYTEPIKVTPKEFNAVCLKKDISIIKRIIKRMVKE